MKNAKTLSYGIIGTLVLQIVLIACNKPKEREETIDKSIQANLVEVSALHDIGSDTTKAYFYKTASSNEISLVDKSTVQMKINEAVTRVLDMVQKDDSKKALEDQLSSGLVAFAIMTDQVKIYKVLTKAKASEELAAVDLAQIRKEKKASFEASKLSSVQIDVTESKTDIQYVEIASLTIDKSGVFENKKTKYYDEKTSILTVGDRPLDVSTHLILKPLTNEPTK